MASSGAAKAPSRNCRRRECAESRAQITLLVVRQGYARRFNSPSTDFRVVGVEIIVDIDRGGFARVEHKDEAPIRTQRAVNTSQGIEPAVRGNKVESAVHQNEIKLLLRSSSSRKSCRRVSICSDHWLASWRQSSRGDFTYVENNDLRAMVGPCPRHKRKKTGVCRAGNKDPAQSAANQVLAKRAPTPTPHFRGRSTIARGGCKAKVHAGRGTIRTGGRTIRRPGQQDRQDVQYRKTTCSLMLDLISDELKHSASKAFTRGRRDLHVWNRLRRRCISGSECSLTRLITRNESPMRAAGSRIYCVDACRGDLHCLVRSTLLRLGPRGQSRSSFLPSVGGGADILARLLADQISRTQNVTMVVENRPGASNTIGTEAAARAAPDGNTLLIATPEFVINPHLRKLNYDPLNGFTPVCYLARSPQLFVVNSELPYRTLDDLLDAARAKPGELTLASAGPASGTHIAFETLKYAANVKMVYVPYQGSAPAVNALLAGHVTSSPGQLSECG